MSEATRQSSETSVGAAGGVPWIHGIRTRLFVAFALLASALTLLLSFWIEREARGELEAELTSKLHAVGGSAIAALRPSLVPGLLSFTPAQAGLRTYRDARSELRDLAARTEVKRIFLADTEGRSFVDTDERVGIGDPLPELRAHRPEMRSLLAGEPSAAPLFTDVDGEIRKSGYLPVVLGDDVVGLIGVEADATFLGQVRSLRNRILAVGVVGFVLALLLAFHLSRSLTRPVDRLVEWTRFPRRVTSPSRARRSDGMRSENSRVPSKTMRSHLETQDRELRAMISGVAHEIRNPLEGCVSTRRCSRGTRRLGQAQGPRGARFSANSSSSSNIVDEFLTYARPASPVPEPIEVRALMEEMAQ
ncbi:MAG: hypothetical protein R3E97_08430 [Candidatus Eisenbacteria bacterium]